MNATENLFGLTDPLPLTGRHSGYVKIPFSSNNSAYGFVPVPLAIVGGGEGPTLLLLAGSFGDEPDSQMAAARIAQALDPAAMNGRVIVMTMANTPAALAGTRNSPLDGRNLNRSYPGDVLGTPTSIIADYIERQLMAVSDIVIDLHSDGRSLRYIPSTTLIHNPDPEVRARRLAVALAFGAPNLLLFHSFEDRNSSGAARRAGAVRIATEIGGPDPIDMSVAGVMRVLHWAGIVEGAEAPASAPPAVHVVLQDSDFVYALRDGAFEPASRLGDSVMAGSVAGHIHDLMRPFDAPIPVHFAASGTVVCSRGPGLAAIGDHLMHLGAPAGAEVVAECAAAPQLRWLPTQLAPGPKRRKTRTRL
jgi:predicted deacylase